MKIKKRNKLKKKMYKNYATEPMRILQEFRLNDRGEIVLVKSDALTYDQMDIWYRKHYMEKDYTD